MKKPKLPPPDTDEKALDVVQLAKMSHAIVTTTIEKGAHLDGPVFTIIPENGEPTMISRHSHPIFTVVSDQQAKEMITAMARQFCKTCKAVACLISMEAWMIKRQAKDGKPLDPKELPLPSQAPDRVSILLTTAELRVKNPKGKPEIKIHTLISLVEGTDKKPKVLPPRDEFGDSDFSGLLTHILEP